MPKPFSIRRLLQHVATGRDSGIAAVEFAIIVPVFLMLFVGATDLGQMLFDQYQLDQAVAAGAEYAALNSANVNSANGAALATSIAAVVESANGAAWANDVITVNNGPNVTVTNGHATSGGTASNADSYYCLTGSPGSWSWGTAYSSQVACAGSGTAGKFVAITGTYTYTPLLTVFHFVHSSTLSQSSMVETQ